MPLVTRADVLEQLGLTDDTTSKVALSLGIDTSSGVTEVAYDVISQTSIRVTIAGGDDQGVHTFDLRAAAYDTVGELVTALNALDGPNVTAGVADDEPSTPLQTAVVGLNSVTGVVSGSLDYASVGTTSALTSFIDTAIAQAEDAACTNTYRKTISEAAVSERAFGGNTLIFSSPVIASATIKRVDIDGTVLETLGANDYYIDTEAGVAYRNDGKGWDYGGWHHGVAPTPARNRQRSGGFAKERYPSWLLEYTGGYTTSTVPADLLGVLRQHAIDIVLSRRANRALVSGAVLSSSQTYRNAAEMFAQHAVDLGPWMRPAAIVGAC